MSVPSPTLEGFRAAFRRPSLTFAEIAWRWTVGAVAFGLFFFWLFEFLGTLPVSNEDAVLLGTKHPFLVGRAIAHILRGSLNRAVLSALVGVIALTLLWIVCASLGRAATVRALLQYFGEAVAGNFFSATVSGSAAQVGAGNISDYVRDAKRLGSFPALLGLNLLRAGVTLAAILAVVGAAILVSFVSRPANPQPGLAFILFLPLAGLVCLAWSVLNWLLSLAGLFAVRDRETTLGSLSAAVSFVREHLGPVFAVSIWAGLAHLTAFSIAGTVTSISLAFVPMIPGRILIAALILVALVYFAVVDWLYIARLAGYVCIAELPDALAEPVPLPVLPPKNSIDRKELILSDIPNLAAET